MTNELAILNGSSLASGADDVLTAWLGGRNRQTVDAYARDLADFARFVGAPDGASAVDAFLALSHGNANRVALAYRASLYERSLSTATIARRIAALRSMVKRARLIGRIEWSLDVKSPRVTQYRDTSGPGLDGYRRLKSMATGLAIGPIGKRNAALVALMHDSALRRGECVALDIIHVDLDRSRVHVTGKGKTEREWITVSTQAAAALAAWIGARGLHAGPLFCRLDRAGHGGGRLTGHSVNRMIGTLGTQAGLSRPVRAHGLRHQAITRVAEKTGGNLPATCQFSRHADIRTVQRYNDNRLDHAGELAQMLGDDSEA